MAEKLVSKLGKDGVLYGANDVPDGEYGLKQINARVAAQDEQFADKYASSIADDSDGPTTADPYPTKTNLSKYGF
jgi:hypothetical protein